MLELTVSTFSSGKEFACIVVLTETGVVRVLPFLPFFLLAFPIHGSNCNLIQEERLLVNSVAFSAGSRQMVSGGSKDAFVGALCRSRSPTIICSSIMSKDLDSADLF